MEKEEEQQESTELWPLQGRQATPAAVLGGKGVVWRGLGLVFTGVSRPSLWIPQPLNEVGAGTAILQSRKLRPRDVQWLVQRPAGVNAEVQIQI